jgi:hypothetical protein
MRRSPFTAATAASSSSTRRRREQLPGGDEHGGGLARAGSTWRCSAGRAGWADDQHAAARDAVAVGEQQVGGPVQRHHRLARARPALDHEDAGQGRTDDAVLLALDGRDDVAHAAGALGA